MLRTQQVRCLHLLLQKRRALATAKAIEAHSRNWYGLAASQTQQYRAGIASLLLSKFGLTPSDRSKVSAVSEEIDPLGGFSEKETECPSLR